MSANLDLSTMNTSISEKIDNKVEKEPTEAPISDIEEEIKQEEDKQKEKEKEKEKIIVPTKRMLSEQEYKEESKKATHDALLRLGELKEKEKSKKDILKIKIQKKKDILKKYIFKENEINDYIEDLSKNKDMLLIKIQTIIKDLCIIQEIDDEMITYYDNLIKTHKKDLDSLQDENNDLKEENIDLDEKIEKKELEIEINWKARIHKLRNKLSEYRKYILFQHGILIFTNIHTCIFSIFGIDAYLNFWYSLFEWIYLILYHIVFFIPNMYLILTNGDNYKYAYIVSVKSISYLIQILFQSLHSISYKIIDLCIYHCSNIYELLLDNIILSFCLVIGLIIILKQK